MHISIRTRRLNVSPRLRHVIEAYLRKALARESRRVASAILYLSPAKPERQGLEYSARLVLWSPAIGQVAATAVEATLRQAVRRSARPARQIVRRRNQKRYDQPRRLGRNRIRHYLAESERLAASEHFSPAN